VRETRHKKAPTEIAIATKPTPLEMLKKEPKQYFSDRFTCGTGSNVGRSGPELLSNPTRLYLENQL
jgi:hypothetical protein